MSLRLYLISCSLMVSACFCQSTLAQTSGGTGGTGQTGTGTSGSGGATTGSSFGTTGTSATGTSSTGTSATGTSATGPTIAAGSIPSTPAQSFIGGNATQGFVGGALQGTQQNANRQFQAIESTQSQAGSQGQTTGTPREVRTTMSIGFSFPTASVAQSSGRFASANVVSLSRFTAARPEFSGIFVAMTTQGVAVLTGSTRSTESKRLAANLFRLQPGVRKVDNQVAVN